MKSIRKEISISNDVRKMLLRMSSKGLFSKESVSVFMEIVPYGSLVLSLITISIWLFFNWFVGLFLDFDFGWGSEYRNVILISIVLLCFGFLSFEIIRRETPDKALRNKINKDLSAGVLEIIEYEIKSLKVFEEPEHGGFIYFLLTADDEVLVMYDSESQDLSIDDQDPMSSSFLPRRMLKISKTIYSDIIVSEEFLGDLIEFPELEVMTAKTSIWPEHGKIVRCKWDKIESKYAS